MNSAAAGRVAVLSIIGSLALGALALQPTPATASDGQASDPAGVVAPRQRVEDAWWTGPIAATGAETLPPGHFYLEPYLFDTMSRGDHSLGGQAYVLYGVAPRITAGLVPSFGRVRGAGGVKQLEMGDLTFTLQYRVTPDNPGRTAPSISVIAQPHFPTAPFDHLRPGGGALGGGTLGMTVGVYGQQYFWLPNGRILRGRINITHSVDAEAEVRGISVYGTPDTFDGRVRPGGTSVVDVSAEYSLSRRLAIAMEALRVWQASTLVTGSGSGPDRARRLPAGQFSALIPSVEYSWNANQGVVVGTRFIFKNPQRAASVTPVIAFSQFF